MAAAATAAADEALPPGDPSFSFFWLKLGLSLSRESIRKERDIFGFKVFDLEMS